MIRFILLIPVILVLAAGAAGASSPPEIPQPCFVPPHPLKEGGRPKAELPARFAGPGVPAPGGAASPYHDTHLTRGVYDAAATTPTNLNTIVILVDFEDQVMGEGFAADNADSIQIYFNRVMEHLNQMYTQMSDGLLTIQWDMTPVYRLPQPMAYYGLDDSIATREAALCRDAVRAADADVDFSQYDTYMLFHAGVGQEADINNNSQDAIWSVFFRTIDFQFWLDDPDQGCEPYVYSEDCVGIVTNDPAPGGGFFKVPDMVVLPEQESQDGFEFGMLGVVAHEFGHGFGLPDLYDTTAPEDFIFADSQGIGAFGLMGAGIWNDNGFFPGEMCVWSKFYVGWLWPRVLRPDEVGSELQVTLEAIQHDRRGGAVRIPLGGDEYFLIENRLRDYNANDTLDFDDVDGDGEFDFWEDSYAGAEFDWHLPRELGLNLQGLDGSGLLIWHIDESIIRDLLFYNLVNSEALHKGVDLEEADGIQDLDKLEFTFEAFGDSRDAFWAPYATEFTPYSEPSTGGYNNAYTGIWITDISGPGAEMTFNLRFSAPGDVGDFLPGWPRDLPGLTGDYQPVTGDLDGDGEEEIALGVTLESGDGGLVVLSLAGDSFFNPGSGPEVLSFGTLNSDPILINLDGNAHPLPELVWVSNNEIYVLKGDGSYLDSAGISRPTAVPYYTFDRDPGRVRLSTGHIEPPGSSPLCGLGPMGEDLPEILVGVPSLNAGFVDVLAISPPSSGNGASHARVAATLPGTSAGYATAMNIDNIDGGLREVVTSVRTGPGRGYLSVLLYDNLNVGAGCFFDDVRCVAMTRKDSVAFTDVVAADLNRDGIDEILVGDGYGYVHLLGVRVQTADGVTKQVGLDVGVGAGTGGGSALVFDNAKFEEHPGWPILVGVLEDDALSVADVDGDGMLEALVFGPGNQLHVYNYNGTSILTLPVNIPGEDRFEAPYLSPLVLDVDGDPETEFLLPLPDGQVRGHDLSGRRLDPWAYLGGGNQGTYPVVRDLDGDGSLELVTVEDVTTAVPDTLDLGEGDESPGLPRTGRILVRNVGTGTGQGPWPVFRHDSGRSGRAPLPAGEPREGASGFLSQTFVMPNPVVDRRTAGFHYQVRSDVQEVKLEVFTADGRLVATLNGPVSAYTDNLLEWDLTNERGHDVAPGLYVARMQAFVGSEVEVRTMNFVIVR